MYVWKNIWICVCECVHLCVSMSAYVHGWRSEEGMEYPFYHSLPVPLKQDSLPPLELRLQLCEHAWLVMWGWDQNFGPYGREASTLNTEPSLQLPLYSSSSIMFCFLLSHGVSI